MCCTWTRGSGGGERSRIPDPAETCYICILVGRTRVTLITKRYLRLIWLGDNDRTWMIVSKWFCARSASKYCPMRSAHSAAVRDECVEAFTSTGNIEDVQMLCTSTRIASTAVKLQADCSDVVFLDIPNNAQTLLQAGARVHRMGQKYPCHLYILTVDGSYDQSAQANQTLKMRPIMERRRRIGGRSPYRMAESNSGGSNAIRPRHPDHHR